MDQKGAGLLGLLIVVAIIGLLAYGGYSFWHQDVQVDIDNEQQVENNIKAVSQSPAITQQIKIKAADDIKKINQQLKEEASSSVNNLE